MQNGNAPWRFDTARAGLLAAALYFTATAGVSAGPEMAAEDLALQPPAVLATVPRRSLMKKADWLFSTGRVFKARALYTYLSALGDPAAAHGVGKTYDRVALSLAQTEETWGDEDQARFWYQRAIDLEAAAKQGPGERVVSAVKPLQKPLQH